MKIDKVPPEVVLSSFRKYDSAPNPRDKAFMIGEIRDMFHDHYMEKIEMILAIAGEMQKHFSGRKD